MDAPSQQATAPATGACMASNPVVRNTTIHKLKGATAKIAAPERIAATSTHSTTSRSEGMAETGRSYSSRDRYANASIAKACKGKHHRGILTVEAVEAELRACSSWLRNLMIAKVAKRIAVAINQRVPQAPQLRKRSTSTPLRDARLAPSRNIEITKASTIRRRPTAAARITTGCRREETGREVAGSGCEGTIAVE